MGYIKGTSRNQTTLMPGCLDDYVTTENPVRVIEAFVGQLDLAEHGFKAKPSAERRPGYHRASACAKCANRCTVGKQRVISFKAGETRKHTDFFDKCATGRITRRKSRRFVPMDVPKDEIAVLKYYPNQRKLRIRSQVVEHPFGTVKRWNDGYYLLVKGRVKAAAEIALSYLSYNFRRVLNLLGTKKMMAMINA